MVKMMYFMLCTFYHSKKDKFFFKERSSIIQRKILCNLWSNMNQLAVVNWLGCSINRSGRATIKTGALIQDVSSCFLICKIERRVDTKKKQHPLKELRVFPLGSENREQGDCSFPNRRCRAVEFSKLSAYPYVSHK